ncbi:DivIVA domain-containing protein [Microbacteriaceae bacterium SG_E_30_P1]|uniref:DivIVA domain-containing protein n=1 Tax=Antiquaquibacter oligotrophicus TaxID=2880260 RepID=A0ABT6KNF9_9MICO|nr:DivIVA domain-containing protein [Antiquaquibacter oligotrophicus]MDH6181399.1 DivIVA domain-containing protein [Antiquaquibacter oligotrophicus]UDF12909.1 DivIVA domain-containing protein [Antiquaquibacter oligotrophicus]
MSTTFPRVRTSEQGYNVEQVEEFLQDARTAYTAAPGTPGVITAASIRTTAFAMQKGGYATKHVDAALERLEDAFAARERERALAEAGDGAWFASARSTAQEILNRLSRPAGQRFDRTGIFTNGYDTKSVDAFADKLIDYFQNGKPLSVDQVRSVAFKARKRGYSEAQVDLVLDSVIDVMLAVR